jgi:hypothetical protein
MSAPSEPAAGPAAAAPGAAAPGGAEGTRQRDWSLLDFAVRLVFFWATPALIYAMSQVFSMTGALLGMAVCLLVFLSSSGLRHRLSGSGLLSRLLGRPLAFEAFYREHPPRAFLYYVAYPFLLPYWLINREARQEFLVFTGYAGVNGALVLLVAVIEFFTLWRPELSLKQYLPVLLGMLLVQVMLLLMVLLPIATTVVTYHQRNQRGRLSVLLLLTLLSALFTAERIHRRRTDVVALSTRQRVKLRTESAQKRARDVQARALRAAWRGLRAFPLGTVDRDGLVLGPPLEAARAELRRLYKDDETHAYELFAAPPQRPRSLVLFFRTWSKPPRPRPGTSSAPRSGAVWMAMDREGHISRERTELPPEVLSHLLRIYGS